MLFWCWIVSSGDLNWGVPKDLSLIGHFRMVVLGVGCIRGALGCALETLDLDLVRIWIYENRGAIGTSDHLFLQLVSTLCSLSLPLSSGDTLLQGMDLLPMLIQTVEKAASQSTQVSLVTEGVAASLLICKMSVVEAQIGKSLETITKVNF